MILMKRFLIKNQLMYRSLDQIKLTMLVLSNYLALTILEKLFDFSLCIHFSNTWTSNDKNSISI